MIREALSLAALLSIALVAVTSVVGERSLRQRVEQIETQALRARIQDEIIGSHVDLNTLTSDVSTTAEAHPTIVWILDLDRCVACFADIGPWSRLEQLADHDRLLLLIGNPSPNVSELLSSLNETTIIRTTRATVEAALGAFLPNTKLLLSADHIAVMADTRQAAGDCGWAFENQLGAMLGLNAPSAIRRSAVQVPS